MVIEQLTEPVAFRTSVQNLVNSAAETIGTGDDGGQSVTETHVGSERDRNVLEDQVNQGTDDGDLLREPGRASARVLTLSTLKDNGDLRSTEKNLDVVQFLFVASTGLPV